MNKQARDTIGSCQGFDRFRIPGPLWWACISMALTTLFAACAAYGPYHPNTSSEPMNSVRGPTDERYKLAFIEFGDQGSASKRLNERS